MLFFMLKEGRAVKWMFNHLEITIFTIYFLGLGILMYMAKKENSYKLDDGLGKANKSSKEGNNLSETLSQAERSENKFNQSITEEFIKLGGQFSPRQSDISPEHLTSGLFRHGWRTEHDGTKWTLTKGKRVVYAYTKEDLAGFWLNETNTKVMPHADSAATSVSVIAQAGEIDKSKIKNPDGLTFAARSKPFSLTVDDREIINELKMRGWLISFDGKNWNLVKGDRRQNFCDSQGLAIIWKYEQKLR